MIEGAGWGTAVASLSLVAMTLAASRAIGLGLGREVVVASARAAAQLLAVGLVFTALFRSDAAPWLAWVWVVVMVIVAQQVVLRRAPRVDGLTLAVSAAVAGSAATSLLVVFGFGIIAYEPVAVVVVAGITIGNAVPISVLGAKLSQTLCRDHVGEIEAGLALGLNRRDIVQFFAPEAAQSALIPQIERTKVVGIIALPGAMTGLLLAGVDPVDAVIVQLLVMYLVLGSAALCVVAVVTMVVRAAVTPGLVVAEWVTPRSDQSEAR